MQKGLVVSPSLVNST